MSRLQDPVKKSSNPVIVSGAKEKKKSGISYCLLFPHPAKSLDKGRLSSAIPTARRRLWTHKKLFRSLGSLDGLRLPNLQENLSWIILGHPSREPVSCGNVFRNDSSIRSQMWRQPRHSLFSSVLATEARTCLTCYLVGFALLGFFRLFAFRVIMCGL